MDLGQRRNPSALAIVERYRVALGRDAVTFEPRFAQQYEIRRLERAALGTPYPDVVDRIRVLTRSATLAGRCTLAMDATGLGAPVLDMMKRAGLGCSIDAVILTPVDPGTTHEWHVPKTDLVAGLRVMLEKKELRMENRPAGADALVKELASFGARGSGGA